MPYLTTAKDFVRVDGTLELNGIQYNYVKRKVAGDTLYLLCLPNLLKTQLHNAKTDFTKAATDIPSNKKSAETSLVKKPGAVNEYNYVAWQSVGCSSIVVQSLTQCFYLSQNLTCIYKISGSTSRP
jgi:hypothetical protein